MSSIDGEAGFAAQDERPFGIQGAGEAELGRLAELEARLAGLGLDLFGGPLGSAGDTSEGDR